MIFREFIHVCFVVDIAVRNDLDWLKQKSKDTMKNNKNVSYNLHEI